MGKLQIGLIFGQDCTKQHQLTTIFQDADFAEAQADVGVNFGDLEKLGVINICGVDKKGLPMIVVSACRFPLNTSEEHHQLFDFIQGNGYNSKTRPISNGRYIRGF